MPISINPFIDSASKFAAGAAFNSGASVLESDNEGTLEGIEKGALLGISTAQDKNQVEGSDADGSIFDNNTFMQYLEGLLASQGQEAVENRAFNALEAEKARQFSASEAAKNRAWQEEMSNTAYQRAVADLQKAGLNPILAYQQGSASTPSGSSAQSASASHSVASGDTLSSILNSFANLVSSAGSVVSVISKLFSNYNINKNFSY